MPSANQSSYLHSNSALLPVTLTWNLLRDTYRLEHISQQSTFWAGSVRRALEGCSFRGYRGADYWNTRRNVKEETGRVLWKQTFKHCEAKRNYKVLMDYQSYRCTVSVCPYTSQMSSPVLLFQCSMTSGLSGSPPLMQFFSFMNLYLHRELKHST